MGQNPHHNTGERWFQMEPNFGWPTHHHQELYLFYIFSQSECLFVYARPERLVDAKLLLGCDDLTSVCMLMTGYSLHWSRPCPGCYDSMGVWTQAEECSDQGPACPVTPGTAQTGYRSLSLGTCGQKRILHLSKMNRLRRPILWYFWPNSQQVFGKLRPVTQKEEKNQSSNLLADFRLSACKLQVW